LSNAVGTIGSALALRISAVAIGFDGSFFVGHPNSLIGTAFAGLFMLKARFNTTLTGMSENLGGADLVGDSVSIYWPVEGDYHATLVLIGTNGSFWRQEYPENRVHVESASTLHQEQFGRNLNAIEIGGFFVAMYEAFVRISEWESERKKAGNGKRHDKSIVRLDTNTSHQEQTSSKKEPKAVSQERTAEKHGGEGR